MSPYFLNHIPSQFLKLQNVIAAYFPRFTYRVNIWCLIAECTFYVALGLKYAPWIITEQDCPTCDFPQLRRSLPRGRILGRYWDKSVESFPLCYLQSPLLSDFIPPNCGLIITNLRTCDLRANTPQKFVDLRLQNKPKNLRICDLRTNKKKCKPSFSRYKTIDCTDASDR
jgi:hypothetical protein